MSNTIKLSAPVLVRNSEQTVQITAKTARKKTKPEHTLSKLAQRQYNAQGRIFRAVSLGAEATAKKAAVAFDRPMPWHLRERASHAVATEKYFEILDTVASAAERAAARAAGYPTWAAFEAARYAR